MNGIPSAISTDDSRMEFDVPLELRLAFLAMRIGEAFAHSTNGNHDKCTGALQDAARYIHEAACVQE